MRFERELLKGATETLVLGVLAEEPGHGYAVAQRLRERSGRVFDLGEGTLYPLLYRLEARGWVHGAWQAPAGQRRRRVYRITPAGRRRLTASAGQWQEMVRGMQLVLGSAGHA